MPIHDAVIVGAGVAGLAAAARLIEAGRDVVVLEARDRTGGRAWTDTAALGAPFDLGCHWMHDASSNPFLRVAERHGFTCPAAVAHLGYHEAGARLPPAAEARIRAAFEAAKSAARAAGRDGRDAPVTGHFDPDDPAAAWVGILFTSKFGVAPERISTLELGRYVWSPDDRPVMEGYGALLRRHFSDVPVTTGAPVRAIDWGRDPVRVETPQGTVEARAAIVTVSTGVLGAEAIAFRPGLPDWKRDAIAALPMASALKIGLRLAAPVHDGGVALLYAVTRAGIAMDIELWPAANPGATCYIDGPPAARLERDGGPAAAREAAVEGMAEIFGARVRSGVRAALVTEWGDDPWTRGTYSNALPGAGDCRARLARPLDDRLYFAGEAATEEYSGDVQGASDSGRAAAGAILTRR